MLTRIGRVAGALAAAGTLCMATSVPAHAQATDAQVACGADPIDNDSAYVPAGVRSSRFARIYTSTLGYVEIKCGNGTSWGAVHIEMKHDVPDWADALTCIKKTIGRGKATERAGGKTDYLYSFTGGTVFATVGSVNGLITAYPTGTTGITTKWMKCSVS